MAMTTPTSQAVRRMPAAHPDVAKMLTVVALCKPFLESITSTFISRLQNGVNLKFSGAFQFLARITRKSGREVCVTPLLLEWTFVSHLFYADDVVVYLPEGHRCVFCRIIARQMPDSSSNRFIHRYVKCKEVEISSVRNFCMAF
jgi:hypothetical protein